MKQLTVRTNRIAAKPSKSWKVIALSGSTGHGHVRARREKRDLLLALVWDVVFDRRVSLARSALLEPALLLYLLSEL